MIKYYTKLVQQLAKRYIAKHKPIVVGVTGSAGKSSAVAAVGAVLTQLLSDQTIYYPSKQLNGELGMPLTIFQVEYFGPTIKYVLTTTWHVINQYISQTKPYDIIVLEYGVDHVGEMDILLDIVQADYAIITNIDTVHFGDANITRQEKSKLIKSCTNRGYISTDDTRGLHYSKQCTENKILNNIYGFSLNNTPILSGFGSVVDLFVNTYSYHKDGTLSGQISILKDDHTYPELHMLDDNDELQNPQDIIAIHINSIETYYLIYAGIGYHIAKCINEIKTNKLDITINLPASRASVLSGVHDSVIIDSSYNSSPVGVMHLLDVVQDMRMQFGDYGVLCLLGEMRELYDITAQAHTQLASRLIDMDIDYIGLVGESCERHMLDVLVTAYGNDRICYNDNSVKLAKRAAQTIANESKKYIILCKGSQNTIFMEEAVKQLLDNPQDAHKLCRQSSRWISKKKSRFDSLV